MEIYHTYHKEFRLSVIKYIKRHPKKSLRSVARQFDLAPKTVINWHNNGVENKLSTRKNNKKVDRDALKAYILKHPDSYLMETAKYFNVSKSAIWANLKAMGYNRKKKDFRNALQDKNKISEYKKALEYFIILFIWTKVVSCHTCQESTDILQ